MRSNKKRVARELEDAPALALCARQCGVFGDLTKLKMCYLLRYHAELSVSDIAELAGTSVSNASHALRKLRAANLVSARREARTMFYSLNAAGFSKALRGLLAV